MADLQEQNLACIFAASAPARTQYLHPYRQCTPRPWGATATRKLLWPGAPSSLFCFSCTLYSADRSRYLPVSQLAILELNFIFIGH
jgi:hypothetical protein